MNICGMCMMMWSTASSRLHAALCASFAACRAVDAVVRGDYRNAFAAVRPPGHHAGSSGSSGVGDDGKLIGQGFCLINHVAVAARHALTNHGGSIQKVAVIDWDLHHGNGTEQILCSDDGPLARDKLRESIFFASIHGATPVGVEPSLVPGTARHDTAATPGQALNVPLPRGATEKEFLVRFREVIAAAKAFGPDLILLSAGFDGHKDDVFRFFRLNDRSFKTMTEAVMDLANHCCQGRLVSVLEGGYHVPTLVRCATVHVRALASYKQPYNIVYPVTSSAKRPHSPPPDAVSPGEKRSRKPKRAFDP